VKLNTRHVVREHVGPLVFADRADVAACAAIRGAPTRQPDGKGLPWSVIWQFHLSLKAFTIAMTMPMAVLVANHSTRLGAWQQNTITAPAMRAWVRSAVSSSPGCKCPVSAWSPSTTRVMLRANHKLRIL
jgi:hypothetical protein